MNKTPFDRPEYSAKVFEKLDLEAAELADLSFYDCRFEKCNFSNAKIARCRFDNCSFSGCNLSLAMIRGSSFREAVFSSSKLVGIDWTLARWPSVSLSGQLRFEECLLDSSSFFGLYLQEVKMEACQARDVDFTEADCSHASFIQTDFTGATFHQSKLVKADFSDATNYVIDVRTNRISGARFSLPDAVNLLRSLDIEIVD
jgi:fluoroquinolone resistance protein